MIRRPPRSTQSRSSAASDVYKRQEEVDYQWSHFRLVHHSRAHRKARDGRGVGAADSTHRGSGHQANELHGGLFVRHYVCDFRGRGGACRDQVWLLLTISEPTSPS
eukprot:TRINITY_DN31744_c0_g1_i1.p1 TRINITY_DN31744_c0_g1~~TRINITY_DN31744_c0_g1_i1.p1  ORF type:complete len:106 (+),score=26.76 TRINITY_DN31744_c0_g1_i1:40-357(+)